MTAIDSPSPDLPPVLSQQLKIAYHSYNICRALGNNEGTSDGLCKAPMQTIQAFDCALQRLSSELSHALTISTEIALLRVKLQLYAFALTGTEPEHTQDRASDARASEHLVKAGILAARIIEAACSDMHRQSWPCMTRLAVVFAAHFLMKLCAVPGHVDGPMAKNSVSQAWLLLKNTSEAEHDHLARACAIIAYLSRTDSEQETTPTVTVRARMSSNLLVDAIWRARSRFSRNVREAKPADYTATAAMEDLVQSMSNGALESYFFDENFAADDAGMPSSGLQDQYHRDAGDGMAFTGGMPS